MRLSIFPAIVLAAVIGCGDSVQKSPSSTNSETAADGHSRHVVAADVERPADYAAGVDRVVAYCESIREKIAAGQPHDAHDSLDKATVVLDWLPELARDSGVPKQHWETINVSAREIRTHLDQLHTQIDSNAKADFDSIAADLQKAIETLSGFAHTENNRHATPN